MQLKIDGYYDIIVEWIPYDHLNDIKGDFATVYSAIWTDGPLYYDEYYKEKWKRGPNKKVGLKCLHNSQNIINELLNEV